jgi:uncharacterized LabA/DUF88 family protein
MKPDMGRLHATVIDGSNFICRLIEFDYLANLINGEATVNGLNSALQEQIRNDIGTKRCLGVDFICSEKQFGTQKEKLNKEISDKIIDLFQNESLVTVHKIQLSNKSGSEKGVDIAVASRLFEMSEHCETPVLIGSDKDYVPALEALRKKGRYVITVGFKENHPIELINMSHIFYDLTNVYFHMFNPAKSNENWLV